MGSSRASSPLFRMRLNHAVTRYSSGGAFSPCLRAFCDDTAFPAAVFGPVAFRVIPSISRNWDDIDGARLLDLAVLRREQARALLQVGQLLRVAPVA